VIKHQVTTPPAALAAGPAPDHIQVGCSDVQSPHHFDAKIPEPPHHNTRQCVDSMLDSEYTAV